MAEGTLMVSRQKYLGPKLGGAEADADARRGSSHVFFTEATNQSSGHKELTGLQNS